jgi:hypothetical protein
MSPATWHDAIIETFLLVFMAIIADSAIAFNEQTGQ